MLEGYVETLRLRGTEFEARGWARYSEDPTRRCEVELRVGGEVLAAGCAEAFRQDLFDAGRGDGQSGFTLVGRVPPHLVVEPEKLQVEVKERSSGSVLPPLPQTRIVVLPVEAQPLREPETPPVLQLLRAVQEGSDNAKADWHGAIGQRIIGELAIENHALLTGWFIDTATPSEPASVVVLVDGKEYWRGETLRLCRARFEGEEVHLHHGGLRIDLPRPQWQGHRVTVAICSTATPDKPELQQQVDLSLRYRGFVERIALASSQLEVEGWVFDASRPLDPVPVALQTGGQELAALIADIKRPDLAAAGIGSGRHGFKFAVALGDVERAACDLGTVRVSVAGGVCELAAGSQTMTSIAGPDKSRANTRYARKHASWAAPVPQPTKSTDIIQGSVDKCDAQFVSGWARSVGFPEAPVDVDLYVNGSLYATTQTGIFRSDVAAKFSDHGYHGFLFELSPLVTVGGAASLHVLPRWGKNELSNFANVLPSRPRAAMFPDRTSGAREAARALAYQPPSEPAPGKNPRIALIVLNRNGAGMLKNLFDSFVAWNTYDNFEILVVDHGSTDNSEELCGAHALAPAIRWLGRGRNYSFSESNNFGARQSDAPLLAFVNNDIAFASDILPGLERLLRDEDIGMAGIQLLDAPMEPPDSGKHAAVQHLGVHYGESGVAPFETRLVEHLAPVRSCSWEVPTVTGAFMACRRDVFERAGMFNEQYFYGYEDVDLCLSVLLDHGKKIVCANDLVAFHLRGVSRKKLEGDERQTMAGNKEVLERRFGKKVRRAKAADMYERPGYWNGRPPVIAFAVTEVAEDTAAGDYYTAVELAEAMQRLFPCNTVFLDQKNNWFDVAGVDVLIVMRDDYDISRLTNVAPHLIKVAWARNWVDRWCQRPWVRTYHLFWGSSETAARHMRQELDVPVEIVRIATNARAFASGAQDPTLTSDYCFTGSYWEAPREIAYYLDPAGLPFEFKVFGHGWNEQPRFAPYAHGLLPYGRMADVYANTKIVVDDANSATKQWGSVNSRVFDAIAAGTLVISNGALGAHELFGDLLPTYGSSQELEGILWKFLRDDELRRKTAEELQRRVLEQHTYDHRAAQVWGILKTTSQQQLRIGIKIGAPNKNVQHEWGDYHFAHGLGSQFAAQGHHVRVDCLDAWTGPEAAGDDVVIVLRGLSAYKPQPSQINIMWNISHPEKVSPDEYSQYDHVFVASEQWAAELRRKLDVPVTALLQCTDPSRFHPGVAPREEVPQVLFVGNSRNVYRPIVRRAIEAGLPLGIYGSRWDRFVPSTYLRGQYVDNGELAAFYRGAHVVLNDHWDSMREYGFVSNRLFDAVACGAVVVSDDVPGIGDIFGDAVIVARDDENLGAVVARIRDEMPLRRSVAEAAAKRIAAEHGFAARAGEMLRVIAALR